MNFPRFDLTSFDLPLVAILRGLAPDHAADVGRALFNAGFRLIEVPLNRPGALEAMRIIQALAPPDALVGGGTMLTVADVDAVAEAGGQISSHRIATSR
jgi:2-dehydro-3-deoxyphosphogalactonate aldolase